jgi:hypothetical protein
MYNKLKKQQSLPYVKVPFKKIWLRNGVYEGAKSNNTMDAADYEKYSKLKVPYTFEELYYSRMIQGSLPNLAMNKSLVEHELTKLITGNLKFGRLPSYDITFQRGEYKTATFNLLRKYKSFCQFLDCGDFDYSLLPEALELWDGNIMLKRHFTMLQQLYDCLLEKERKGLLHIVIGAPGTGKTQYVCDSIQELLADNSKDEVKIITLSNLAGNNMNSRLIRNGIRTSCCSSYSREHFVDDDKFYKAIVLEEASMLSMAEVPIMLKALTNSEHCYVTGDCNQLPGFLGLGNILYAIISEFAIEKNLVVNHRCSEAIVASMNSILAGLLPNIVPKSELGNILEELIKEDADFIVTCFTNAMMEKLNLYAMCIKLDEEPRQYLSANNKDMALLELTEKFLIKFKNMPCRCKKQIVDKVNEDGKLQYIKRFFSSERGTVHYDAETGKVSVTSTDVVGHHYEYESIERFLRNFDPGFACTIYKAQGLEWDYTILWNDMNSNNKSSNACYVAYTRSRKKSIILSEDAVSGTPIEYRNIFRYVAKKEK